MRARARAKGDVFRGTVIGRPVPKPPDPKPPATERPATERPAIDLAQLLSQARAAGEASKGTVTGRTITERPTTKSPITKPSATQGPASGGATGTPVVRLTPQVRSVTSLMQHQPVRLALKQMTGRDFDFDQTAWQRWWETDGRELFGVGEDLSVPRKQATNPGRLIQAKEDGSERAVKDP